MIAVLGLGVVAVLAYSLALFGPGDLPEGEQDNQNPEIGAVSLDPSFSVI
ncbi:hypothetical protein [Stratiformator vulcanicus]|nr:hypothetical protein [Stratiformator vulcanicus]